MENSLLMTYFETTTDESPFSSFSTFKTSELDGSKMAIIMSSRATAGGFHSHNPTKPLTAGRRIQVLWYNLLTDWRPWELHHRGHRYLWNEPQAVYRSQQTPQHSAQDAVYTSLLVYSERHCCLSVGLRSKTLQWWISGFRRDRTRDGISQCTSANRCCQFFFFFFFSSGFMEILVILICSRLPARETEGQ